MKIGILGPGAVGSYYGGLLCRGGHDVHFLLRSDYTVVRAQGLQILSPRGDFHVKPHCARTPQEIGACDLVVIALKTTANHVLGSLLPPMIGPDTRVITLQNGLGNEELIVQWVPPDRILGGLCFVCINRLQPGLVRHMDHGLVIIGQFQRAPDQHTLDLADTFSQAGITCKTSPDLECAHWEKLVWNVPFNGLGVAGTVGYDHFFDGDWDGAALGPVLPTDVLLGDPRWQKLVRELMLEVISGAGSLGYKIRETLADDLLNRTLTMGSYKASTLLDFEQGLPIELDSLFQEPLRRATHAGAHLPRFITLVRILTRIAGLKSNPVT